MAKIAMIGAGSLVFCQTLTMDILATPALQDSDIWLMNPTRPKLDRMTAFVQRVITENKLPATVHSTTDRRAAIDGADFVVVMFQVGGVDAFQLDYEIPLKYGVDQCIADSMGPGGVFRGLRHIPVLAELAAEMNELCPHAILLNYANPMGMCLTGLTKVAKVDCIGLCHGVQTTLDLISRYVEVPKQDIGHFVAGINHMAWFLSIIDKRNGEDLYPKLKERCERPEYYANEKVRCEVMRHFGYFMTESTGHLSEYLPWFRSHERALKTYCDEPGFGGESGAYYKFCRAISGDFATANYLESESAKLKPRSVEYCSYIMEAKLTDKPFRCQGNVRNDGYVTNLPNGCCVEIPTFFDRNGLHPVHVGALPPQCAALNQSNVTVQLLGSEAALAGDPELAMQAIAMDPLTSSVCTLNEIRAMTSEMLEAQRQWLPRFAGKKVKSVPGIVIPPKLARVDVPVDPALAIANRFAKLAG